MRRILFCISMLLGLSAVSDGYAKDYALILAGGCNRSLSREMFEEAFWFAETVKKRDWDVVVLHSNMADTERLNYDYRKKSNKYDMSRYGTLDFTEKNVESSLKRIANDIKKGDQLLINIITHGLPLASQKGHIICLDGDSNFFNIDMLKNMGLNTIYSKGAKIGILDNSCYGGESIPTFDDIACVVSTQTPRFPSYSTVRSSSEYYDEVFGITSVIVRYLDKNNKALSLEDYYLKALADYPSWTALKDPVILSVFPNMSGDEKGNALSDFASIHAFLSSDQEHDLDLNNYYEETFCEDLTDIQKSSPDDTAKPLYTKQPSKKSQTVATPSHEQCIVELKKVSEEKYKIFQKLRYSFNLKKRSLGLKAKAVRNIRKELKELTGKIKSTYSEIKSKEKLLKEKENSFLEALTKFLKDNQTRVRTCVDSKYMKKLMAKSSDAIYRRDGAPSYKEVYELLSDRGCSFFEASNEVECSCCEKGRHSYCFPYDFHDEGRRARASTHNQYCLGFAEDIADVLPSGGFYGDQCDTDAYRIKAKKQIKLEQDPLLNRISREYASLSDQLLELKNRRRSEVEKFNVIFNKFKAMRYIKETPKISSGPKIRMCREFKI